MSEDPFETQYLRYSNTGLLCKGDGESAIAKGDDKWEECECSKECNFRGNKCKLTGKLFFIIKDIDIGGLWRLQTQSYNTIQNILTTLNFLKCMNVNITEHNFRLITEEKQAIVDGKVNKFTTIKLKMIVNTRENTDNLKEKVNVISEEKLKEDTLKKKNDVVLEEDEKINAVNEKKDNSSNEKTKKEVSKRPKAKQEKKDNDSSDVLDDYENCLTLVEIEDVVKKDKTAKKAIFCTMKDDEKIELLLHPDITDEVCSWVPSSTILPKEIYEQNGKN